MRFSNLSSSANPPIRLSEAFVPNKGRPDPTAISSEDEYKIKAEFAESNAIFEDFCSRFAGIAMPHFSGATRLIVKGLTKMYGPFIKYKTEEVNEPGRPLPLPRIVVEDPNANPRPEDPKKVAENTGGLFEPLILQKVGSTQSEYVSDTLEYRLRKLFKL